MRIVNAHKSIFHFTTHVTGHAAHSSQPHRGVSAVMVAARLVNWIDERQRRNAETAKPEMRRVSRATGVEFTIGASVPGFESAPDSAAVRLVELVNGSGPIEAAPYAAEAGQYDQAGYSVAMCGPGSIDQAHKPDEYISLEQVDAGTTFMRRLIEHLS
jgi:acetylornithine deacetylase/succinyl-diaminopimelate desuccinylase-like protein